MSDEIAAIEQEIEDYVRQQAEVAAAIRSLAAEENPAAGIFRHQELHAAKQDKLRLDFEIQYRRARINRIRFGG